MWRRTYRAVPGTTTEVCTSSSANPSFVVPIDVRPCCCLRTRLCAEIGVSRARGGGPGLRGTTLTLHRSFAAKAWISGIHHFLFLSDPRTLRVVGEPKAKNHAVIALSEAVGMNVHTVSEPPPLLPSLHLRRISLSGDT